MTLACHAALTARDTHAQNLVGIMFATGLGLEQNIDTALEWLEEAAERGHGGANFNLALIYGTGTVQGSYRLCGIVESPERADSTSFAPRREDRSCLSPDTPRAYLPQHWRLARRSTPRLPKGPK